jgi:hypothetical protein
MADKLEIEIEHEFLEQQVPIKIFSVFEPVVLEEGGFKAFHFFGLEVQPKVGLGVQIVIGNLVDTLVLE